MAVTDTAATIAGRNEESLRERRNVTGYLPTKVVFVCAALALLSGAQGCATLSEEDCLTIDWAVLGETDGRQGQPVSELNRYRRQCAEYDVVPDSQAYTEARERGLAVFCTPGNAFREGRSGARDELVCPAALAADFRSNHELGRAVFTSLSRLRNDASSIRSARSEIEELRTDIEDREESLREDDLAAEQENRIRDEIDSMDGRIDDLQDGIVILAGTLAVAIADYRRAVEAARSAGFDEPMESELIRELTRLAR